MGLRVGHWAAAAAAAGLLASAAEAQAPGFKVIGKVAGPDGGWDYAAVDSTNHRVLIGRSNGVGVLDLQAMNLTTLPGPNIHQALSVEGGKEILTTEGAAGAIHLLEGKTGVNLATIATGKGADAARIDPQTGLALVVDHSGGDIALVNLAARKLVGDIAVGGTLEEVAADGAGHAYVNVENKGEIAFIDLKARKVTAHHAMAGCEGPTGLALVADQKLLLATCDGLVAVVRADTGALVKTIKIGDGADGIAYDAARHLAFVPAGRDGTLAVLQVKGDDVTLSETVKTQRGARTIALDPATGRVYLPTAQYAASAGGGRPSLVPGSFEMLVVGR